MSDRSGVVRACKQWALLFDTKLESLPVCISLCNGGVTLGDWFIYRMQCNNNNNHNNNLKEQGTLLLLLL